MSDKVKLTYIPYSNVDKGFYESIVEISDYNDGIINPFILYNKELDINVENLDSIINKYTEYIDESELYKKIETIMKEEDEGGTLILYGFDLSLDEIKDDIMPRLNDNFYVSINVIVDDDDYISSSSINIPMSVMNETDEEWKKHKEELTEELQKISSIYQKLNSVFRDFMAPLEITEDKPKKKDKKENKPLDTSDDDLKILGYMTIPLDTPPEKPEKETIIDIADREIKDIDENFVCYTYEDMENLVSVVRLGKIFSIEDENDNKVEFNEKALDFIIESLMKLYDK